MGAMFTPGSVIIQGLGQALQLMVEGDKWELYIPFHLGYKWEIPNVPLGSALIVTVELLKIEGKNILATPCEVEDLLGCTEQEIKYVLQFYPASRTKLNLEFERLHTMELEHPDLEWKNRR